MRIVKVAIQLLCGIAGGTIAYGIASLFCHPNSNPPQICAKGPAMYEYWCQITRVVDADTFDGSIDIGFNTRHNDRFRVHHIDAYEKNTKKGKEAIILAKKLLEGKSLKITTAKPDKYGRWLCDITLEDGRNYAQVMIDEGYAVPYEGKTKTLPQKD